MPTTNDDGCNNNIIKKTNNKPHIEIDIVHNTLKPANQTTKKWQQQQQESEKKHNTVQGTHNN